MSYNRAYNSHNPNQGPARRVLCLCSAGLLRSPTAAVVLQREFGYNTRAAGTEIDFALIPYDDVLLEWADEIVCMTTHQANAVKVSGTTKPIYTLDVPDRYGYMDKTLQKLILEAYSEVTGVKKNADNKSPKVSRRKRSNPTGPTPSNLHSRKQPRPQRNQSA